MGFVLDCEDGESTIESLSECFDCEQADLINILQSIDIEAIYSDFENSPDVAPEEYLYDYAVEKFGEPGETESVCWFHLTRTFESNDFSDGILPLSEALDLIWETLFLIFEGTKDYQNLKDMRENGVDDDKYNIKFDDSDHSGPYGMLVREIACRAKDLFLHDYLELPEIIVDICDGYAREFGDEIYDEVSEALTPCVVKFSEDSAVNQGTIEAALYYAYTYSNDLPVSGASVCDYDGKDCAVPNSDIAYVEFLDGDDEC
ncbi:hypothetical protein GO013_01975 [Pseudodesulfovibrio sp. JC047]|uniref:hypothetical protein n=1 Tax=Pseudodesulfovibrio sp. JC047 TaxID=2683199 RepID=UPI0013D1C336|nr:hypothetical protein [Pseudodesulfovibrio sp. JC047]NDV18185.1 hypothetical protein [Pseudodesulfovibrio sp. JC047]